MPASSLGGYVAELELGIHLLCMTTELARKVGLKLFEKHLEQYTPSDPLYEEYTNEKGKKKRRKVYDPSFSISCTVLS